MRTITGDRLSLIKAALRYYSNAQEKTINEFYLEPDRVELVSTSVDIVRDCNELYEMFANQDGFYLLNSSQVSSIDEQFEIFDEVAITERDCTVRASRLSIIIDNIRFHFQGRR